MTCHDCQQALGAWTPDGAVDLPDDVALHLDDCDACRAAFDARFAPLTPAADPVPADLARLVPSADVELGVEVPPPANRRRAVLFAIAGLGVAAAAAVALFAVPSAVLMLASGDGAVAEQTAPQLMQDERGKLESLGYIDAHRPARAPDTGAISMRLPENRKVDRPVRIREGRDRTVTATPKVPPRVDGNATVEERNGDGDVGTSAARRPVSVNPWVRTAVDPLSTFAVDVDTASYTMARRSLREGYLPSPDSVRVEEFVNYLPYDYPAAPSGSPFAVGFEAAPSPWTIGHHIVQIGVQGKHVRFDERKPVHLTFLVDTSGSMSSSDKLGLVKDAIRMLAEELEDGDTLAIATYAGGTRIALQPTPASDRSRIEATLRTLNAGGSTAMASGIDLAYQLADRSYAPGAVNRVIIASDGDANVGNTDPGALSRRIQSYADRGITLTTLGFGTGNYRDQMMERLANDGDGNYFYIDTEREARRVLVDRLTSTLEVIARDVKIQVEYDPARVRRYRLLGYENRAIADRDFRVDSVDAGEIGAAHQVTALYEVELVPGSSGPLGAVRLRYKAPGPDAPAAERMYPLPDEHVCARFVDASRQFRMAVASATFAELLRGSDHVGRATLGQVRATAIAAERSEYDEDRELVTLIGRAAQLRPE